MRYLYIIFALASTTVFNVAFAQTQPQVQPPSMPGTEQTMNTDSIEGIPKNMLNVAMVLSINATIGKENEAPRWESKDVKYTVPGGAVSIRLTGTELAIIVSVTPYKQSDDSIILVAQGQIWYKEGNSVRYRTTVSTLTVAFGEKVFFYPFGAKPASGDPLRLELILNKYVAGFEQNDSVPAKSIEKKP